jgi:hypothetical protein
MPDSAARAIAAAVDPARRAADIINGLLVAHPWDECKGSWVAIRLSDGGSDGVLYDSKRAAVRHQTNEFTCAYVALRSLMGGATAREMAHFLSYCRKAYDAGFRLPDPDAPSGGPDLIAPVTRQDMMTQAKLFVAQRRI